MVLQTIMSTTLEAWKDGKSPMDKSLPRYKRELPQEEIPAQATRPDLNLCQVVDGKLVLPRDVRQQFLTCPVWGGEWRSILTQFDKDWGQPIDGSSSTSSVAPTPNAGGEVASRPVFMPNEPTTLAQLKEKYGDPLVEMPVPDVPSAVLLLMTGPMLFVLGKEAVTLRPYDGPIILHGAGNWLTGDKATKYETENPGKGCPCIFNDDKAKCVLEDQMLRERQMTKSSKHSTML